MGIANQDRPKKQLYWRVHVTSSRAVPHDLNTPALFLDTSLCRPFAMLGSCPRSLNPQAIRSLPAQLLAARNTKPSGMPGICFLQPGHSFRKDSPVQRGDGTCQNARIHPCWSVDMRVVRRPTRSIKQAPQWTRCAGYTCSALESCDEMVAGALPQRM